MSTLLPSNSSQALCEGILAENGLLSGHLFRRVLTDPNMRSSFNPDVLGFGVRLSILITNICAGILMIFGSREEKRTAIQNTAIQNIIMLLGTLISLSRGQLSFYDGLFALLVVHSPLSVYSAFYGFCTYYSRGGEKAALVSSLLIVLLSLSLDWVVYKARELGATCDSLTLKHYLLWVFVPVALPCAPALLFLVYKIWMKTILPICIYIIITPQDNRALLYGLFSSQYVLKTLHSQRFNRLGNLLRCFNDSRRFNRLGNLLQCFDDIPKTWPPYLIGLTLCSFWGQHLVFWVIEPGYSFSYGQLLSVLAAVAGFIPVLQWLGKLAKPATPQQRVPRYLDHTLDLPTRNPSVPLFK